MRLSGDTKGLIRKFLHSMRILPGEVKPKHWCTVRLVLFEWRSTDNWFDVWNPVAWQ